jgi:hypothetical protein
MERIWMAIAPNSRETRVLMTDGPGPTLLKARLSGRIHHPRAVPALLEALALWQGRKVHAVLAVAESCPFYELNPWTDFAGHDETPLYELDLALLPQRRPRKGLHGLGDFRELHRLLATEVAR